jgi:hypothetical protein
VVADNHMRRSQTKTPVYWQITVTSLQLNHILVSLHTYSGCIVRLSGLESRHQRTDYAKHI